MGKTECAEKAIIKKLTAEKINDSEEKEDGSLFFCSPMNLALAEMILFDGDGL